MAANPNAKGDAILQSFQKPWKGRLTHEEHLQRCLEKMPPDWVYTGDKDQRYPKNWTGGDIAAWEMEAYRVEAARHMMRVIKQGGNVKAMELYYKVIGTPEARPGAGVQVNINKHTNNNSFRFVVEEVTAGGVQRLLDQHTNTQVVEGEAREVEEEGETREEEDTRVVEVGVGVGVEG